jgi:LemA protein
LEVPVAVGLWIGGILLAILLLVTWVQFNRMVVLRNRVRESWSNVDTELKRRYDLVPNLVAAVKGYLKHEQQLLEALTRSRAAAVQQRGPTHEHMKAERGLVAGIDRLLAVAEGYPNLKASQNFLRLQEELAITEDRIQAARRFYNGNVRDYRDSTRQFPGLLFAGMFGFGPIEFFQVESMHVRQAPQVAFERA